MIDWQADAATFVADYIVPNPLWRTVPNYL